MALRDGRSANHQRYVLALVKGTQRRTKSLSFCWADSRYSNPLHIAQSAMENIRGGDLNISDEPAIQAAAMAGVLDFNVGEMGNRLSDGQKQRISIARAIVSIPNQRMRCSAADDRGDGVPIVVIRS